MTTAASLTIMEVHDENNANGANLLEEEEEAGRIASSHPPTGLTLQKCVNDLTAYAKSADALELLACIVVWIVGLLLDKLAVVPNMRPIPYQQLQTGEYVLNLEIDETYVGNTVSSTLLFFLGGLIPFLIQL